MNDRTARHLARRRRQKQRARPRGERRARRRSGRVPDGERRRWGRGLAIAAAVVLLLPAALVAPWRWLPPPTTAFMLRERWLEDRDVQYRWASWSGLSRNLALCVVAAEDQKFPDHFGFDFDSIAQATQESGRLRGASTISQQVAKNLFLWPGRSFLRKGIEAYFTVWIEALWPKRRILEVYLNVAEFGPGVFGAEAASRRAFGKSARDLSLRESALLTAVLPSPKRMSASRPSPYVQERAAEIESAARSLGAHAIAGL
jgi:monofunctional glycosyltransferase